jgi:hypothetical protein
LHSGLDDLFFAEVTCMSGENDEYVLNCLCMVKSNDKGVRCIFVHVYFPHLLGGFLHILTWTCNYMLWPLAPREYNLSIPNMVSEQ